MTDRRPQLRRRHGRLRCAWKLRLRACCRHSCSERLAYTVCTISFDASVRRLSQRHRCCAWQRVPPAAAGRRRCRRLRCVHAALSGVWRVSSRSAQMACLPSSNNVVATRARRLSRAKPQYCGEPDARCLIHAEDKFMREWAQWAVRNMCEISSQAQDAIRCGRRGLLPWSSGIDTQAF